MSPFFHAAALVCLAEGLRMRGHTVATVEDRVPSNGAYTFEDFVREFGRAYEVGSDEYLQRSSIFQESMLEIRATNSRVGRAWTAGASPFMDWTDAERVGRLHGYVKSISRRMLEPKSITALQMGAVAASSRQIYGQGSDSFESPTPPVRMQGACGSCWAIASAEAVEAQIMKANSSMFNDKGSRLSIQTLLDCVQNPKHCGGKGGCDGATTELAFDFIQENGLPLEADVPYRFAEDKCKVKPYPSSFARATIMGWQSLPSNQAQPLLQAIVQSGPVVVSVGAWKGWYHYKSGIYDDCERDVILNHGLLAKGYGAEDEVGKYWLLQNSWGERWGEQGTIRLLRRDDEDSWCGTDTDPQQGTGCDGPRQNVTVCGSCGILYDTVVPRSGQVSFPDHAIDQSYQDVVANSAADLMLSTVGDSAARQDDQFASKTPRAEIANDSNSVFVKVQGSVSKESDVTRAADSDIHVLGVIPRAQEFESSLSGDRLTRVPWQSETPAPQEFQSYLRGDSPSRLSSPSETPDVQVFHSSRGDDSLILPPSYSETAAPQESQRSSGEDTLTRLSSQFETSAPQDLQGLFSDEIGPPSPSELRSFGIPSAMSGTSSDSWDPLNPLDADSSTRPPSQSTTLALQGLPSDDGPPPPPSQLTTSAPQSLQSSRGSDSLPQPASQSDTPAPQELKGVLSGSMTKREKAMLDLRRWR